MRALTVILPWAGETEVIVCALYGCVSQDTAIEYADKTKGVALRGAIRNNVSSWFPERRVFVKSGALTHCMRLSPVSQLMGVVAFLFVAGWMVVTTALLIANEILGDRTREHVVQNQLDYAARLKDLAYQRDNYAIEAHAAQGRFNAALAQISVMQSELLESETHRRELEAGMEVIQETLRDTVQARDIAREEVLDLEVGSDDLSRGAFDAGKISLDLVSGALAQTAAQRDQSADDAKAAQMAAQKLEDEIVLIQEKNDQIFRQLEDALTISLEPLKQVLGSVGLPKDRILEEVRRGYSGQGGPLMPFDASGALDDPDVIRANRILEQLDELNLYRIAVEKIPFAMPVKSTYRFTSPYGYRRDPISGAQRMHKGVDFAARMGTPLYSAADGVVTFAGWQSGYGRFVRIKHDFGIETRYSHLNKIRVQVGEKVSRGQRIGDMGTTGRSTGVHLHYEIRENGKAVNPMVYIKAAQNVF